MCLETYAIAALVNFFDNHQDYTRVKRGVECGNILLSYHSMHQDVRAAMDYVHMKVYKFSLCPYYINRILSICLLMFSPINLSVRAT
jgi:hypothetical protein